MGILNTIKEKFAPAREPELNVDQLSIRDIAKFIHESVPEMNEAFTQADIELALDDRGWLVGGKRMAGELDPLSRTVQVNRSRYYWLRDPLAKQAVRLWTDYTFGAEAINYQADSDASQTTIDKFMKNRKNRPITSRAGQRRLSNRLLVDGELFFAFFSDGTVRTFDCLQMDIVTNPDDEDEVWAYKRTTAPANNQSGAVAQGKTLYYRPWTRDEADGGTVNDPITGKAVTLEADVVMYHLALDAFDKRGNSLFGCCSDWAREHRHFMTARVALTSALAKFAYKGTVKGGQKAIDSIRKKMESTYVGGGLSGGTEHNPATAPGGTWLQNEGVNLEAMPRSTGANEASADANGLKLMVSAGTGIMLHYFGDPSTGNLATATAMELPMLKMFGAYQVMWKDAWRDLFSIILEESPDDDPEEIKIELPAIIADDIAALGAFLTQFTAIFPEAKIPEVMRECLVSMNIEDIDGVMDKIADQKEENDAKAADLLKQGIMTGKDGKPALPVGPKDDQLAGNSQDKTEAARVDSVVAALNKLTESLK